MDNSRELLRNFLNKECVWKLNHASSKYIKIYTSTTAISPNYKPPRYMGSKDHFLNVTAIIMKPKGQSPRVTIYINNQPMHCCSIQSVSVLKMHDPKNIYLIYFGKFYAPPPNFQVPLDISTHDKEPQSEITRDDIVNTSTRCTIYDVEDLDETCISCIGKCAWYARGTLFLPFLSIDYMMFCPSLKEFVSLPRFINLLTRCEDKQCVPCYGYKIHVNCCMGYTSGEEDGCSNSCPCILSCTAIQQDYAPITGNRNLLSLLFEPEYQKDIVALKFFSNTRPCSANDIFCGVLENGNEVPCNNTPWELLQISDFYTRLMIYNCQVLKRICIRSY
nr:hypothetical protein [Bovine gammaherpesvirus 4]